MSFWSEKRRRGQCSYVHAMAYSTAIAPATTAASASAPACNTAWPAPDLVVLVVGDEPLALPVVVSPETPAASPVAPAVMLGVDPATRVGITVSFELIVFDPVIVVPAISAVSRRVSIAALAKGQGGRQTLCEGRQSILLLRVRAGDIKRHADGVMCVNAVLSIG